MIRLSAILPISLKVAGRKCVVIGGGNIATEKVASLLKCDAQVTVVSPDLSEELEQLKSAGRISHMDRKYQRGDLNDAFLVVAATQDNETNRAVFREAEERGMLVNVVDVPELCNFYYPAIVRRGPLTISIATEGKSPALAGALREKLEADFDEGYADLLELFGEAREAVKSMHETFSGRRDAWRRIVEQREEILSLLRSGKREAAQERVRACIS